MTHHLDRALAALAATPPEVGLGRLEADVWAAVRREDLGSSALGPLRWAAVSAALGMGVLAGGVSAAGERGPAEVAAFDVSAPLAPSGLLDRRS